ncbi:MAG: Tmc redox complex protein TmcD [Deltaproteobacteria bacterium]|nr:Tmc redox complex protein TmcD [Deltaproteobacteria bacterium]
MKDEKSWDWHSGKKEIPVKEWQNRFNWVEEPYVSPDGEKIASIVNTDEARFSVCVNGETWENNFEKAWSLKFMPDGRLATLVSNDEEWTACVDGVSWETRFDYTWDLKFTPDGSSIAVAVQKDGQYGMAVNDTIWDRLYENISGVVLSDQGTSAAVVQADPLGQGDIEGFSSGIFCAAVNGVAQQEKFMNIWDLSFDSKGKQLAYSIRKNRVDYSISRGSQPWKKNFQFSWKPEFIDKENSVIAPVRQGGKWFLFKDEAPFWNKSYGQLWKLAIHGNGKKIAAVVSDNFGKWTVCENDETWNFYCDTIISDLFYSDNGNLLIAVFKDKGLWDIAVNQKAWNIRADKLWSPVVSRDDTIVAARMEKDGVFYLVVNGKVYKEYFDMVFEPQISPDNDKILLKTMKNGIYSRQILSLDKVL